MNILVFPFGSAGDVHPMIALSLALQRRGHAVRLAANGYFQPLVQKAGIDFIEQGTREELLASLAHPDLWKPTRAFAHVFRSGIARAMRAQYELIERHHSQGPLIVAASCLAFGARIARDKLGVPLASVHLQPGVFWSEYESPVLPGIPEWAPQWLKNVQYWIGETFVIRPTVDRDLNGFRKELGLAPVVKPTRWWSSPDQNVCLFPEWFAAPQPDWPTPRRMTSFPLWDESQMTPASHELERFLAEGAPPIVFAPGSANTHAAGFFRSAVDACKRMNRRGLLLTRFHDQIPGDLPASIRWFDYIPFSHVLPRALALVHHGGIGTAAQALLAGIPQLVMPLAHDQFDNAARLRRLGVADVLAVSRFTGPNIATKLDPLIASPEVRRHCQTWQEKLAAADPFLAACDAIESLASGARHHPRGAEGVA